MPAYSVRWDNLDIDDEGYICGRREHNGLCLKDNGSSYPTFVKKETATKFKKIMEEGENFSVKSTVGNHYCLTSPLPKIKQKGKPLQWKLDRCDNKDLQTFTKQFNLVEQKGENGLRLYFPKGQVSENKGSAILYWFQADGYLGVQDP